MIERQWIPVGFTKRGQLLRRSSPSRNRRSFRVRVFIATKLTVPIPFPTFSEDVVEVFERSPRLGSLLHEHEPARSVVQSQAPFGAYQRNSGGRILGGARYAPAGSTCSIRVRGVAQTSELFRTRVVHAAKATLASTRRRAFAGTPWRRSRARVSSVLIPAVVVGAT